MDKGLDEVFSAYERVRRGRIDQAYAEATVWLGNTEGQWLVYLRAAGIGSLHGNCGSTIQGRRRNHAIGMRNDWPTDLGAMRQNRGPSRECGHWRFSCGREVLQLSSQETCLHILAQDHFLWTSQQSNQAYDVCLDYAAMQTSTILSIVSRRLIAGGLSI